VCIQTAICGIISIFWICGFITTTRNKRDKCTQGDFLNYVPGHIFSLQISSLVVRVKFGYYWNAMKKNKKMRSEYDFSDGVRGKHFKAYREGHTVKIRKEDGSIETRCFTEEDGSIMLDPDVKQHFPDSNSVNKALRSLISESRSPA
jgi:hypothetical protein